MAAHFAAQGGLTASGLNFFHLGLDQGVPCFVHQGLATCCTNGWRQALRALHIKQDGALRHTAEYVLRKKLHLAIGVNGFAILCDDAQAIAITIKCQAEFGARALQSGNEVF